MMKFDKLFVILILLFIITACGSKKDRLIGKWKIEEMKLAGGEEIAEEVYKELIEGASFEFKDNKTFTVQMMGENQTGTWELSDDVKTLTTNAENGQVSTFTIQELEKEKLKMTAQENNKESFTLTLIPF